MQNVSDDQKREQQRIDEEEAAKLAKEQEEEEQEETVVIRGANGQQYRVPMSMLMRLMNREAPAQGDSDSPVAEESEEEGWPSENDDDADADENMDADLYDEGYQTAEEPSAMPDDFNTDPVEALSKEGSDADSDDMPALQINEPVGEDKQDEDMNDSEEFKDAED